MFSERFYEHQGLGEASWRDKGVDITITNKLTDFVLSQINIDNSIQEKYLSLLY